MKLSVGKICDAMTALTMIGNRQTAAIPQKGRYRLMRMRAKLQGEFDTIQKQRDAMIQEMGVPQTVEVDGKPVETGNFEIPPTKARAWADAWAEFAKTEVDVDVEPIPFASLFVGTEDESTGGLEVGEMMLLGELIA